jgi:hypothetical protein
MTMERRSMRPSPREFKQTLKELLRLMAKIQVADRRAGHD